MRVKLSATIIEGYSDKPTGRSLEHWSAEVELPGIPCKDDLVETGYGDHRVNYVAWQLNGPPIVVLQRIYTTADTMEHVLSRLTEQESRP